MPRKARISEAVADLMAAGGRHAWTLEELHADLAEQGQATDFSTVYRAAEKLAAGGVVRKVLLDDGRARFELAASHHDHLHCTRCNALVPVSCALDAVALAALETEAGVAITGHQVVFHGLCPNCRKLAVAAAERAAR